MVRFNNIVVDNTVGISLCAFNGACYSIAASGALRFPIEQKSKFSFKFLLGCKWQVKCNSGIERAAVFSNCYSVLRRSPYTQQHPSGHLPTKKTVGWCTGAGALIGESSRFYSPFLPPFSPICTRRLFFLYYFVLSLSSLLRFPIILIFPHILELFLSLFHQLNQISLSYE